MRFEGIEECRPCHWMDRAFCPGAEEWLKGRGGSAPGYSPTAGSGTKRSIWKVGG